MHQFRNMCFFVFPNRRWIRLVECAHLCINALGSNGIFATMETYAGEPMQKTRRHTLVISDKYLILLFFTCEIFNNIVSESTSTRREFFAKNARFIWCNGAAARPNCHRAANGMVHGRCPCSERLHFDSSPIVFSLYSHKVDNWILFTISRAHAHPSRVFVLRFCTR